MRDSAMFHVKNHKQLNIFDPWAHLGPKRRKLLDSSWAGLFQQHILPQLPVESLRRHYARTCRAWTDRLEANRNVAAGIAGDRRVRIWQIYLAGCAYGFAMGWMNLYQILGSRQATPGATELPLTRRWIYR